MRIMCCVYVLQSLKDKKLYVGATRMTPAERLKVHNRGSVRSTKGRRPFEIVYSKEFASYKEATQQEKFFKTGAGRRQLLSLIRDWAGTQVVKGDRL